MKQVYSPQLYISGIRTYVQKLKPGWIILLVTSLLIFVEIFFNLLFNFLGISHVSNYSMILREQPFADVFHFILRFLENSILAPLVETFIFQQLLFKLFVHKFKFGTGPFIIISGIIFGLSHWHSATTIIVVTVLGFILNYFYQLLLDKNSEKTAFLIIAVSHSNLNTWIIIFNIIGMF